MAFGVTSEGFKAKKFDDIITELADSLNTELGIDIDSDPDSVAKIITNIYALALADEWALPQALQSMFDIDKAEGKHLDDLVGYIGLRRIQAAATSGAQYVTASKELTIPASSVFKDTSNNTYNNPSTLIVSATSCTDLSLDLASGVTIGDILTVNANGVISSITVAGTVADSVTLLVAAINNTSTSSGVSAEDTSVGTDYSIEVTSVDDKVSAVIVFSSNLVISQLTSFGTVALDETGAIGVGSNIVTTAPSISGIVSTTNRYAYNTGRTEESDIDLRNRHKLSLSTAGSATVEAIRADLLAVSGVSTVIVLENDTLVTDSNSIPAKAFLAIVKGGDEQDIGDALWLTKGAGIETHGDIVVSVTDSQGIQQGVRFSRPDAIYIHMHVDYKIYDEESDEFPIDGEQQMLDQILAFGNALNVGEDVIPQRFSSQIFQTVGGLQVVDITVGSTVGPNDPTPILSPLTLPIDSLEEADFDSLRITFTEV